MEVREDFPLTISVLKTGGRVYYEEDQDITDELTPEQIDSLEDEEYGELTVYVDIWYRTESTYSDQSCEIGAAYEVVSVILGDTNLEVLYTAPLEEQLNDG